MADITIKRGAVSETSDLSIFKQLNGNREVDERRVRKIADAAKRVGWMMPTVVVNEKMEVIDGQGRIEVARRYGLPVFYQVIEGIGADECIAMNLEQTNWTMRDFCKSWEERGNEDYKRFNRIVDAYDFPFSVVACAATGLASVPSESIKGGRLKCSQEQAELASAGLTWLEMFKASLSNTNSAAVGAKFYMALLFIFTSMQDKDVDLDRVVDRVCSYQFSERNSFGNVHAALAFIEERYNARLSAKSRIYFAHEYKKLMAENLPWYEAKWGWKVTE